MPILWPNGGTAEPAYPNTASSGFRASGEYGMRWHPVTGGWKLHEGIDLIGISDGIIRAPFAGVVTISAYSGGYGNLIEITAPNGDRVRLAHNSRLLVGRGARVSMGQHVAIWGTTGSSTGIHCHFEFIPAGRGSTDPRPVLRAANAGAPAGGGGSAVTPPVIIEQEDEDMKLHRDNDRGSIYIVDEMGADHLLDYISPDIGGQEYVAAAQKAWDSEGLNARDWDITNAIAQRRWAQKRGEIVNDVVARLVPVIEKGQAVALDPELVKTAIRDALANVEVDSTLDDVTIDRIANTVLDRQHERLAE